VPKRLKFTILTFQNASIKESDFEKLWLEIEDPDRRLFMRLQERLSFFRVNDHSFEIQASSAISSNTEMLLDSMFFSSLSNL
jgi:hypothetical protein